MQTFKYQLKHCSHFNINPFYRMDKFCIEKEYIKEGVLTDIFIHRNYFKKGLFLSYNNDVLFLYRKNIICKNFLWCPIK